MPSELYSKTEVSSPILECSSQLQEPLDEEYPGPNVQPLLRHDSKCGSLWAGEVTPEHIERSRESVTTSQPICTYMWFTRLRPRLNEVECAQNPQNFTVTGRGGGDIATSWFRSVGSPAEKMEGSIKQRFLGSKARLLGPAGITTSLSTASEKAIEKIAPFHVYLHKKCYGTMYNSVPVHCPTLLYMARGYCMTMIMIGGTVHKNKHHARNNLSHLPAQAIFADGI